MLDKAWSRSVAVSAKAEAQGGLVTLRDLHTLDVADHEVRTELLAGRWRRVHPRCYALFTGPLDRQAAIWAAVLYAGDGATTSHETGAELWRLLDGDLAPSAPVHVTVPVDRRVATVPGVRIHYAHRLPYSRHPTRRPPVTRVEDTVLDLADRADTAPAVVSWITRACQRRRTTPARLARALAKRKKIRWRTLMEMVLADVSSGAETPLELLYLQRVERAHGLPEGCRQRHRLVDGGVQWVDVDYEKYATLVELDGRIGHREDGVFRDHDRDNASTELGRSTLRYGWADCYHQPCAAAQQVVRVLWTNGWEENPRRCGPGCTLPVP